MTNNRTIDGVSRLIKLAAELANRRPLRPLEDLCERQKSVRTSSLLESVEMCGDTLAAIALDIRKAADLLTSAAPVVERQPDASELFEIAAIINRIVMALPVKSSTTHFAPSRKYTLDDAKGHARLAFDQLVRIADQQSTIAQLQARVAELESGKISALADGIKTLERIGTSIDARQQRIDALTAPPAPVAVVLPERKSDSGREWDSHHVAEVEGWNACLDATAALNGVKK